MRVGRHAIEVSAVRRSPGPGSTLRHDLLGREEGRHVDQVTHSPSPSERTSGSRRRRNVSFRSGKASKQVVTQIGPEAVTHSIGMRWGCGGFGMICWDAYAEHWGL